MLRYHFTIGKAYQTTRSKRWLAPVSNDGTYWRFVQVCSTRTASGTTHKFYGGVIDTDSERDLTPEENAIVMRTLLLAGSN